jgi:hypothetical protein
LMMFWVNIIKKMVGVKKDLQFQCFWHVICDQNDNVVGDTYITIDDKYQCPDWAKPIARAFIDEFGYEFWVD